MNTRIHPVRIPFQLPINEERRADRVVMSYLILGEGLCLVDTGPAGCEQRIVEALNRMRKAPSDISLVINTHEHPDHIGGNAFFQDAGHPDFACHADAVRWIETLEVQSRERPIYGFHTLAGQHGVHIRRKLHDGDRIELGDEVSLEVVFCPGHSPGSISLFCPQERALIIGDAVQPVDGLPLYVDLARTRESLKRLMAMDGVQRLYLAWVENPYTGKEIQEVFEASLKYLDQVDRITREVLHTLQTHAPEEITREVLLHLNLDPPPVMPITVASIMAHLSGESMR